MPFLFGLLFKLITFDVKRWNRFDVNGLIGRRFYTKISNVSNTTTFHLWGLVGVEPYVCNIEWSKASQTDTNEWNIGCERGALECVNRIFNENWNQLLTKIQTRTWNMNLHHSWLNRYELRLLLLLYLLIPIFNGFSHTKHKTCSHEWFQVTIRKSTKNHIERNVQCAYVYICWMASNEICPQSIRQNTKSRSFFTVVHWYASVYK